MGQGPAINFWVFLSFDTGISHRTDDSILKYFIFQSAIEKIKPIHIAAFFFLHYNSELFI